MAAGSITPDERCRLVAPSRPKERAELSPLCPGSSDVNLLGDGQSIIDLDAEIPHGALDFGVTEQQLDGTQISCTTVDERRLGSSERMRAEKTRVQSDTCNPIRDEPRVLACCDAAVSVAPAGEKEVAGLPAEGPQVLIEGFPCFSWRSTRTRRHA